MSKTSSRKNARSRVFALLSVLAILVVIYAGIPIYASFWHLFHGNSAKCDGLSIPVPDGWWARDNGCSLITRSPKYSFASNVAPAQMFVNSVSAPPVVDAHWRAAVIDHIHREGNTFNGTKELTVANTPTVCFEYSSPSKKFRALIVSCNMDRRAVLTFLYDDPKLLADFYGILRGIN